MSARNTWFIYGFENEAETCPTWLALYIKQGPCLLKLIPVIKTGERKRSISIKSIEIYERTETGKVSAECLGWISYCTQTVRNRTHSHAPNIWKKHLTEIIWYILLKETVVDRAVRTRNSSKTPKGYFRMGKVKSYYVVRTFVCSFALYLGHRVFWDGFHFIFHIGLNRELFFLYCVNYK